MSNNQQLARLDRLRESANDSARNFRVHFVSYILVLFYALVVTSNTDDVLLFQEGYIHAPIINAQVPIVWFFVVTPLLLVLLHFNLFIQGTFVANKVHMYKSAVLCELTGSKSISENKALVHPLPLAHFLLKSNPHWNIALCLNLTVVTSLILLTPATLIWIQIKFLPFQSEVITWLHRLFLLVDFLLILGLWPKVVSPNGDGHKNPTARSLYRIGTLAAIGMIFSVCFANSPGGKLDEMLPYRDLRDFLGRKYELSRRVLVEEEPQPEILAAHLANCNRASSGSEIWCNAQIQPGSIVWCRHAQPLSLNGRSFKYADLSNSILCGVDLRTAKLDYASLVGANLREADLRGSTLIKAQLEKALFVRADLSIWDAERENDSPRHCTTDTSSRSSLESSASVEVLHVTNLYDADISRAVFHGANLCKADLREVTGHDALFYNARMEYVKLQDSLIGGAQFFGTKLSGAKFDGANMNYVKMIGVNMDEANLNENNLMETKIIASSLKRTTINLSNLETSTVVHLNDLSDIDCGESIGRAKADFKDNIFDDEHNACFDRVSDNLTWDEYYRKRARYLVGDVACRDESGYFAEGLFDRYHHRSHERSEMYSQLQGALSLEECLGVTRGWNMYEANKEDKQ